VFVVVVLCVQVADSMLLRPRLAARSIEVGLVVPWVVALLGYAVYGVGGAAYGAAFALFGLAVLDRVAAATAADEGGAPAPA
jgi:predicted PurR-regulated permease PerM